VLGNGRHDVDCQPIGLRKIRRLELELGFHQVRDEGNVASQAIQLGDYELCAMQAACL
jgi:hypothetical protein